MAIYLNTRAWMLSNTVAAGHLTVRTGGYSSPGDGGGAEYVRVGSNPNLPGSVQDASGAWFKLILSAEGISVHAFGAKGDGTTNDQPAIQDAIDFVEKSGGGNVLFEDRWYRMHNGIRVGRYGRSSLKGAGSCSNEYKMIDSQDADGTVLWTPAGVAPSNVKAVHIGRDDHRRINDCSISGLAIVRDERMPTIGSGSVGLKIEGGAYAEYTDMVVMGYDDLIQILDSSADKQPSTNLNFRSVSGRFGGSSCLRMASGIACYFELCNMALAKEIVVLEESQSVDPRRSNGNTWVECFFRGYYRDPDHSYNVDYTPGGVTDHGIKISAGFANRFVNCGIEQTMSHGVVITNGIEFDPHITHAVFENLWENAVAGNAIRNANVKFKGGRIVSLSGGYWALDIGYAGTADPSGMFTTVTDALIQTGGDPHNGTGVGNLIHINGYNTKISNCVIRVEGEVARPFVAFAVGSSGNHVVDNHLMGMHNPGYSGSIANNKMTNNFHSRDGQWHSY